MEMGTLLLQANQTSIDEQILLEEGMSSTTNEGIDVPYIPHLAEEVADFIIEDNTERKKISKQKDQNREYLVTCVDDTCTWFVRASKYKDQDLFKSKHGIHKIMEIKRESFATRLAIVSDRHKTIDYAVHMVYPNASHGACMFHLLNNLKRKYGNHGEELQMNFIEATKAYTKTKCERFMKDLDRLDKRSRPYLEKVGYETRARSYSPTKRYSMMTSNIVESLNAALKVARGLPIDIFVECLRSLVQKWVWTNSNNPNGTFTKVSTSTKNELRHDIISKMKYEVFPFKPIEYQVRDEKEVNFTVNMQNRTCTCNRFQEDEMPCGHAIAVIAKRNLRVYDYCAKFYKIETLKVLYQENVHPLPHKDEWNLPQHLDIVMLPPKETILAGRLRKKRIRSRGEPNVIFNCGNCGQPGHTRKTCRNPPIEKPNKQKK
ncbi:uncharacterized protein LOC133824770 [Humulus lupulus]|uniref:uncharacterized protein LOC133824770 n=1 Tax=Humulus lupulus TaxID=3486 RepID=UPI002B40C365|nr:uncharacterized protein LOC133824770 [Humulus lupulus]